MLKFDGFLLTRQWRDTREGVALDFWWSTAKGAIHTRILHQEIVFFIAEKNKIAAQQLSQSIASIRLVELPLRTFENQPVVAVYALTQRHARQLQQRFDQADIIYWESDIKPPERYLMERFVTAAATIVSSEATAESVEKPLLNPRFNPSEYRPNLYWLSLDIETSMDAKTLYSIAALTPDAKHIFMVGEKTAESDLPISYFANEKACLLGFFNWFKQIDPDVIIGWNLIQFDLWVLETICQRLAIALDIARGDNLIHWRQEEFESGRRFITIPGRQALDGIELLKAANYRFERFSLQTVAKELLGESKLIDGDHRGEQITVLFEQNKIALAEYNLHDCVLVSEIFERQQLINFAIERSQLTGLLLDRIGGSVAAFEYLYLPRLHRAGYIAPNLGELSSDIISPGGYVMNSRPGIYHNVLVLDFKSLYPSIMRTFFIDPCAFWDASHRNLADEKVVPGFNGAKFSREKLILPGVIKSLWQARDIAKKAANEPLSHAIKIIMNSFYGVLGSTGCRFFDPRVASSITLRGHEIIQQSRDFIEQQGYTVIYGDTDSLFVWLEQPNSHYPPKPTELCEKIGARLAKELNLWWKQTLKENFSIESSLEVQFETHYTRFLMPTIRGSEEGTKKRYAGVIERHGKRELVFKGLETVRTDWTLLAKSFQVELYRRVFEDEPYTQWIVDKLQSLLVGELDEQLVYRKRLRRNLDEYVKNVPPHIQAARKLSAAGVHLRRGDMIEYVITLAGPEPLEKQRNSLDYQHYRDKQLLPVADGILHFLGHSFNGLTNQQLSLFTST